MSYSSKLRGAFVAALVATSTFLGASVANASGPVDGSSCASWLTVIDVSSSNPGVQWAKLPSQGIVGAYVKVSEGDWYINPLAANQATSAAHFTMAVGYYDYAQPGADDPVADARYFVSHFPHGVTPTLPPVLDLEWTNYKGKDAPAKTIAWAAAWISEVQRLTHSTVLVYTGSYYSWSYAIQITRQPLWIAAYPLGENIQPKNNSACNAYPSSVHTGGWRGWSVWQFTDHALYIGMKGVDSSAVTPYFWKTAHLGLVLATPATPSKPAQLVLTMGSAGPKVLALEYFLRAQHLYTGALDAKFGPGLRAAVLAWQHKIGLAADGEWGPSTQAASDAWLAKQTKPKPPVTTPTTTPATTTTTIPVTPNTLPIPVVPAPPTAAKHTHHSSSPWSGVLYAIAILAAAGALTAFTLKKEQK
jgi:GH25 family lysozyme M1 (1,4-beta-N-acetylmuramidase)